MIGYAFCGSFCTHAASLAQLRALVAAGEDVLPILSHNVYTTDTRFGRAADLLQELEKITGRAAVCSIVDAEPLGPKTPLELLIISPCTGNTLAKMAHGITDTPVTMAAKAHLRADRPLLIALASNDALSANLGNLAALAMRKSVYFVPMRQDDPQGKPHSLVADFSLLPAALSAAREARQLRPMFL